MKECCGEKSYPYHGTEIKKLNRISGQVDGIKRMIEERRYCPDILTQLRAIRAAVRNIESEMLEAHLKSCVTESLGSGNKKERDKKIEELKEIFKRFD